MEEIKIKKEGEVSNLASFLKPYWLLNVTFAENNFIH